MMNNSLEKFQSLLRELFQFDCADLDFGIYRIMNHKRDVIQRFITQDLPKAVADELERGALAEQSQAAGELKDVATQIKETLGADALDADGNLAASYHGTPLGKKYLSLKAKAAGARAREAIEANIYNHLYAFFSRYYQDGDFISKRRYSKRERYAIPYNGEEAYLYWANHDQYYIKTAEYFTDYTFTAPNGVSVHFKLQAADVEQNNVKGDKRFFLPRLAEIAWGEAAQQLVIPFEYRPLTEQENITYGQKNQQESILAEALEKIPKRLSLKSAALALAALNAEKHKTTDGQPVTYLEHHLRQYTRRNTSDFFIHKDLKGFLTRELDFYLKNEVLNLDEMDAAGEDRAKGWFQTMHVIKAVGDRIIEFLHQIEEFQRMLWEKRKFITETQYCITVGNIAKNFYPDIAACEPLWDEWKGLFHIDKEQANLFTARKGRKDKRIAFLKAHPTLVLDTKHFDQDFVDRLLGNFDDLDFVTDGLLIHSDNWQALSLLGQGYQGAIDCFYIDPPFNAKSSEILYKNDYKHSSWLSLMSDRIGLAHNLMNKDGVFVVAIDEVEQERLGQLLSAHFSEHAKDCVIVNHNPSGQQGDNFSVTHEYAYFVHPFPGRYIAEQPREDPDDWDERNFRDVTGEESLRGAAKNCFYPILVRGDKIIGFGDVCSDDFHPPINVKVDETTIAVYPVDPNGIERKWRFARNTVEGIMGELRPHRIERRDVIDIKRLKKTFNYKSNWIDARYSANNHGTQLLNRIIPGASFSYPKSIYTVRDCIHAGTNARKFASVVDYFAGSGTTGHAVINLNREDGGRRKFILVEVADYLDTVLLPRIKKVTYTPEWNDGKPERMATAEEAERGPLIFKVIRLESYEDALNNIAFDNASGQQVMQFDDYLLQYMLKWEARASETLLHVEKLARPFHYKLHIRTDGQTRERLVDIPETFNYLLGLHVQTRHVYDDGGRRYLVVRGRIDNRQVAVIWREIEGWRKADFERDRKFLAERKLTEGADEVFVNGNSLTPGARALEPVFKARMFAPVNA